MSAGRVAALPLFAMLLPGVGCLARGPQAYRLAALRTPDDRSRILTPPGVANAAASRAVLRVDGISWRPECSPAGNGVEISARGRRARVTVARDELSRQPAGWLSRVTAEMEAQGCLAQGGAQKLTARILEAVPLDPAVTYRLTHADSLDQGFVDIGPEHRLQVVSPVMKVGVAADAPVVESATVSGNASQIEITARSMDNLTGVETAWYAFEDRTDRAGFALVPISVERSIQGRNEPAIAPIANYFGSLPRSAYYRLFYKSALDDAGTREILVVAATRGELERRTEALLADPTFCQAPDPDKCAIIPRRVAVNPLLFVSVNGEEIRLPIRSTVRRAVAEGGGPASVETVLPRLSLMKPFKGKLREVIFDRSAPDILDLMLTGGKPFRGSEEPHPRR